MEDFGFGPLTVSPHFFVLIKQLTDQEETQDSLETACLSLSVGLETPARHRPVSFASFRAR